MPFNLADNPAHDITAFHSLLAEVLGPGDDEAAFLSLLKVGVLCHDVVAAHAQCKDEASEYTGFEGHGNADTPELKSVPEWLEEKLAKTATEEHKDAEKWHKNPSPNKFLFQILEC